VPGLRDETGAFRAARGERILAFRSDEYRWRDLGKLDDVMQADRDARQLLSAGTKQIA
jgi:NDP-sugar pyrophosphorylase family protein